MILRYFFAGLLLSLGLQAPASVPQPLPSQADREIIRDICERENLEYSLSTNYYDYVRFKTAQLWKQFWKTLRVPEWVFTAQTFTYILIVILMAWLLFIFLRPWFGKPPVRSTGLEESAFAVHSFWDDYRDALAGRRFRQALGLYVHHAIHQLSRRFESVSPVMTLRECAFVLGDNVPLLPQVPELEQTLYGSADVTENRIQVLIGGLERLIT